ncbi:unnamed protein product [Arctia plantaginis]|uniref:Uncharacterized protein n=1 Tax=Arctia plantaginis TaxID=874455 RepID=A0A8S1B1V6_ARCPL|nr:unnamed protein product [Arctia plantaginis]
MWITTMFKKMDESNEEVIANDRRESLTFPKLYSLYAEWMTENKPNDAKATQEQYRQIFYKEFNLDFFKPKKDQCLKGEVHQKASESEKETTAIDYALHIANKSIVREIKENDKAEAKQLKKTLITACFDLQNILTTPHDQLNWIDLDYHKVKTRRLNKNKNLDTLWSHTLVIAYKSLHPITQSKYKDLMSLCSSGEIPEQYRMFYVNLPHSNTVTNTVDLDIED